MPGLMWRSFARRLLEKNAKKRKLDESNPRPLKRLKTMEITEIVFNRVADYLTPNYEKMTKKREEIELWTHDIGCPVELKGRTRFGNDLHWYGEWFEVIELTMDCAIIQVIPMWQCLDRHGEIFKIEYEEWDNLFVKWVHDSDTRTNPHTDTLETYAEHCSHYLS